MILWIIALCLMGISGWIGLHTGGIRAAFALIGLIMATLLARALSGLVSPLFALAGLKHPLLLAFVAPLTVFLIILLIFKTSGEAVHRKVDAYYKYKATDHDRSNFERLNHSLGLCVALANGAFFVFLLAALIYVFGYFTVQVSRAEDDGKALRVVNALSDSLDKSGLRKAVAPFAPVSTNYYDAADIAGDIFHNPLLQTRLASYPAFLGLAEKPEFRSLGDDVKFQQFWMEGHSFSDLIAHPKIEPLIHNPDLYTEVMALVKGNLKDFKNYLETGLSAKYDEEKILGRWTANYKDSVAQTHKSKPNLSPEEARRNRVALMKAANATLTAMIDNRVILKMPLKSSASQNAQGTWKDTGAGTYLLSFEEKGRKLELQAAVEPKRLLLSQDGYTLVFEK
jgi:colicin V production protein